MTEQEAREEAIKLRDSFNDYVNPYIGSGMLSNTYDDRAIAMQAKQCAIIAQKQVIRFCTRNDLEYQVKILKALEEL